MKSIETQVIIHAPLNQVWQTLMVFKNYPNWNPFIQSITGNPQEGKSLVVSIHPPGKSSMTFTPVVLKNEFHKEFRWKGKLGMTGIFDGEHYFKLEKVRENKTRLIHGEKFTGLLTLPFLALIGENTKNGFEQMNQALKNQVEKQER